MSKFNHIKYIKWNILAPSFYVFQMFHWCEMSSLYIDGLVHDCSNSIVSALELPQSCTKPSIWCFIITLDRLYHVLLNITCHTRATLKNVIAKIFSTKYHDMLVVYTIFIIQGQFWPTGIVEQVMKLMKCDKAAGTSLIIVAFKCLVKKGPAELHHNQGSSLRTW